MIIIEISLLLFLKAIAIYNLILMLMIKQEKILKNLVKEQYKS
jgi:hypothetical protein